ncbi:hypothetical protein COU76_03200 [Candidatus Peregrinibacteria bacterium CG10_big_fil_rev_8_21_14_0_10_49_10]|nr:MAG: hypothetical protein COU76_03200 [Candidatus Peregrinibacteria bacterium CG10_big_fil_rev_8_21_14_0_10_49_10]
MSKSPVTIIVLIIGIITLGFAFQWPAITQGWPFLLFLLCPLMHLFMGHDHGGGGHKEHQQHPSEKDKKDGGSCH